jgi:hypothetical protein
MVSVTFSGLKIRSEKEFREELENVKMEKEKKPLRVEVTEEIRKTFGGGSGSGGGRESRRTKILKWWKTEET